MNESPIDQENLIAKKIRRFLLLKTNQELKVNTQKNINIMINTKTLQELNQAYNSYQILLSEASPIYFNYVEIFEETFPNISVKQQKKSVDIPNLKKLETFKHLDSSFESQSPDINYIPKKMDLGQQKLKIKKLDTLKNDDSPKIMDEIISLNECKPKEEKHSEIKTTKLGNKVISKVIDKIVSIKLQTNMEEDDENIMENVVKMRKYCSKLIKRKKKLNKRPIKKKQSYSPKKLTKDKTIEKNRYKKRQTLINSNEFVKNYLLLGTKEKNHNIVSTREENNDKINIKKIYEKEKSLDIVKTNMNNKKTYKLDSLNNMKIIEERANEKINLEKKRKLRRGKTLNEKNKEQYLKKLFHKKEAKKSDNNLKKVNPIITKESMNSTKFTRPLKSIIIQNSINNTNINPKKDSILKYSLFYSKKTAFNNQKIKKDKDNEKSGGDKNLHKKNVKRSVQLCIPEFNNFKVPSAKKVL